jgi:hypothetical protein
MEAVVQNRFKNQRRNALILLYLAFSLEGVLGGFALGEPEEDFHPDFILRVGLLSGLLLSLGFLGLCSADARLIGRPLVEMARLGIFFGWPVGVPIYLLWARGLRGFGLLLLHGFLLFVTWVCSALAAGYLLYGAEVFR